MSLFANRSPARFLPLVFVAAVLTLVGCIEPSVVSATGQRTVTDTATPTVEPTTVVAEDPPDVVEEEPTPTPVPPPTAVPPPTPTPTPAPLSASVPNDLCDEASDSLIGSAIAWSETGLRDEMPETTEYVDSADDRAQSFASGTLSCTAIFADGSELVVLGYSNYSPNTYAGTRDKGFEAGAIPMLTAATPNVVRVIVEYPWATSPTGVAALDFAFTDPNGIEAAEIDAVQALAAQIRDRVAFSPPEGGGPTYPDWYTCGLDRFGTAQGDTAALAETLGQRKGLHAEETIDRQFGSVRCSLYEGPGTAYTGGFAVGDVFVALAAYEAGGSTFADTVRQVRSSPGVEEGTLEVAGTTYTSLAAEGSFAVLITDGGDAVISVFNPEGTTSLDELESIMTTVLGQLFG